MKAVSQGEDTPRLAPKGAASAPPQLHAYYHLLSVRGPVVAQVVLGPARYVEMVLKLRAAGFDV